MRSFDIRRPISRRRLLAAGGLAGLGLATGALSLHVPGRLDPNLYSRASRIEGTDFPFRIFDPTGATQMLSAPPQRIASAGYASDEALMLLVDQDRVVTVTEGVELKAIHNAYGYYSPQIPRNNGELEKLIATQPDIVLVMDTKPAEQVKMLIAAGIVVVRFSFYVSFEQVDHNFRQLAALLDVMPKADTVLADMWARLARVGNAVAGTSRPRVLSYGMSGHTTGKGTLNDDMIIRAGGLNVANETGQVGSIKLPQELAIALQPDVIITGDFGGGEAFRDYLYSATAWQDVPAIRDRRIYIYKSSWGTTGSPFRALAVEQIAGFLHPERLPS